MNIEITSLTKADVGRWVSYLPSHGKPEFGRIKGWGTTTVFVVYCLGKYAKRWQDYTGAATNPEDLVFVWPGEKLP